MYQMGTHNGLNSVNITDAQVEHGKEPLERLIDRATKNPLACEERKEVLQLSATSPQNPLSTFIHINNLLSIIVQEDQSGKWHADFVLKHVPEGWPDTFGTPAAFPLNDREEAWEWAYQAVHMLLQKEQEGSSDPDQVLNTQATVETPNMLDIVKTALEAKGRLPSESTQHSSKDEQEHSDVDGFYLIKQSDGWRPCFTLRGGACPITTGDAASFPDKKQAFIAGAMVLCELLTGSTDLPFFVVGDQLRIGGYGTGGFTETFMMSRPAPWI